MDGRVNLFVAGAHTDVGKTHVAAALLRVALGRGLAADAFKPVLSGFDAADPSSSDAGRLLAALAREPNEAALDAMSPWRFSAPLAPPMAARLEGVALELAPIAARCGDWLARAGADFRLVEGVGGLMSPLTEDATGLDLIEALGVPVVLVGGSYLGAISHTLTALEILRARDLPVATVAVSQDAAPKAPDFEQTVQMVRRFAGSTPVLAVRRGQDDGWAEALLDTILANRP